MAFMGMVFAGIALLILGGIALAVVILLITATILLLTKHRKIAAVLYCIAAVPVIAGAVLLAGYLYRVNFPEFQTYDGGTVTLSQHDIDLMRQYIVKDDMQGLSTLLDRNPDLIYYLDTNNTSLLEYGLSNCNVEIMQIAVDHGARFDDEIAFSHLIYSCSLQDFFDFDYWVFAYTSDTKPAPRFRDGETTEEIIAAAQFAIDHGAATSWERYGERVTFAEAAQRWVNQDGILSDEDKKLLALAGNASQKEETT